MLPMATRWAGRSAGSVSKHFFKEGHGNVFRQENLVAEARDVAAHRGGDLVSDSGASLGSDRLFQTCDNGPGMSVDDDSAWGRRRATVQTSQPPTSTIGMARYVVIAAWSA